MAVIAPRTQLVDALLELLSAKVGSDVAVTDADKLAGFSKTYAPNPADQTSSKGAPDAGISPATSAAFLPLTTAWLEIAVVPNVSVNVTSPVFAPNAVTSNDIPSIRAVRFDASVAVMAFTLPDAEEATVYVPFCN